MMGLDSAAAKALLASQLLSMISKSLPFPSGVIRAQTPRLFITIFQFIHLERRRRILHVMVVVLDLNIFAVP